MEPVYSELIYFHYFDFKQIFVSRGSSKYRSAVLLHVVIIMLCNSCSVKSVSIKNVEFQNLHVDSVAYIALIRYIHAGYDPDVKSICK